MDPTIESHHTPPLVTAPDLAGTHWWHWSSGRSTDAERQLIRSPQLIRQRVRKLIWPKWDNGLPSNIWRTNRRPIGTSTELCNHAAIMFWLFNRLDLRHPYGGVGKIRSRTYFDGVEKVRLTLVSAPENMTSVGAS